MLSHRAPGGDGFLAHQPAAILPHVGEVFGADVHQSLQLGAFRALGFVPPGGQVVQMRLLRRQLLLMAGVGDGHVHIWAEQHAQLRVDDGDIVLQKAHRAIQIFGSGIDEQRGHLQAHHRGLVVIGREQQGVEGVAVAPLAAERVKIADLLPQGEDFHAKLAVVLHRRAVLARAVGHRVNSL